MLKRIIRIKPIHVITISHRLLMLGIIYIYIYIYIRSDNRTFNNTGNIYKHINQYSTDVLNNYNLNKTHNVKKTYFNFTNGVVINKHNAVNTNDTYNVTKINKLVNFNDDSYFTKKIEHKTNTTYYYKT